MLTLKRYVELALEGSSFGKLAVLTGFSSRQLWLMAQGGPAAARRSEGKTLAPGMDDRYLKLGKAIDNHHGVDPEDVRRAAQRSYEQRRDTRKRRKPATLLDDAKRILEQLQQAADEKKLDEEFLFLHPAILLLAAQLVPDLQELRDARSAVEAVGYFTPVNAADSSLDGVKELAMLISKQEGFDYTQRVQLARMLYQVAGQGRPAVDTLIADAEQLIRRSGL